MEIVALKEKYGGRLRYIFMKDLQAATSRPDTEEILVKMEDTTGQLAFLKKGYRGIAIEKMDEEWHVRFFLSFPPE
ncbi:hypothetical protein GCM10011409_44560 [Lentibacillus populi]|uniref:Uncharacterized protein n=1 Tax=Lentibacillus populi TaxID=1827502 RepID=A0A9W5U1X2_9BACI|nr:hypothetical protein GCM10011409_44560 [Lentibacillus populi]